ncbi:hypothetical protein [Scrofimicrobium sp. R131]|uniref:Membrane protein DedA with SNARE-associated domain n=1 Tax=Scrofimicrobium appendicitidis TaxID=3079930 RepID=A0AAU7V8Z2_9ACTO
MSVPSWAESGPLLIGFLFVVVFCRAQGTYWLARTLPAAAARTKKTTGWQARLAAWFDGPTPRKGAALLERWGIVIIPLCFLTVGIQTAIIAGAGVVRMNWRRFTLAMIPGAIAWAFLYGLGLLAVWTAAVTALAGNPWSYVALVGIVALFYLLKVVKQRASRRLNQVDCPAKAPLPGTVSQEPLP